EPFLNLILKVIGVFGMGGAIRFTANEEKKAWENVTSMTEKFDMKSSSESEGSQDSLQDEVEQGESKKNEDNRNRLLGLMQLDEQFRIQAKLSHSQKVNIAVSVGLFVLLLTAGYLISKTNPFYDLEALEDLLLQLNSYMQQHGCNDTKTELA